MHISIICNSEKSRVKLSAFYSKVLYINITILEKYIATVETTHMLRFKPGTVEKHLSII